MPSDDSRADLARAAARNAADVAAHAAAAAAAARAAHAAALKDIETEGAIYDFHVSRALALEDYAAALAEVAAAARVLAGLATTPTTKSGATK